MSGFNVLPRACLASLSLLLLAGCTGSAITSVADDDDDDDDIPPSGLQITPGGPLVLGFGQEQGFHVLLLDDAGEPMAGEPVQVSLIGPAHDGYVSPFEFVTDSWGEGDVTFKAPEKAVEIGVRFSSPAAAADVTVEVQVSASALGITVTLDYLGNRALDSFEVAVHDGVSCDQLTQGEDPAPVEVQSAMAVPASFWFGGLLAGHEYAVQAVGYNGLATVRARACASGVLAGSPALNLVLVDLPYALAGVFAVSALVETGGDLGPAVQELAASLEGFTGDVPGAILDAVRQGLEDPVAAEQFDGIRAGQALDSALADDLEQRGVDVAGVFADLWSDVEARLAHVALTTRLEIGAATDGIHPLYHTVERLEFDGVETPYAVALQDQAQGTAQAAAGDPDLLEIAPHSVGLGLGGPLVHVLRAELEAGWGNPGLAEVLEALVDCEAVTALLAAPLSEVADTLTIHAGCLDAMIAAREILDGRKVLLDSTCSQIGFQGSCRLADPGSGNQVAQLTDGVLSMTWGGAEPFGPMAGTFSGQAE